MFFQLWALFLKMCIFEIVFFLTQCLSNQLNFSVVIRMYKIPVFDETFSLLATVAMIAENVTFSSFYSNCHKGNKFVHHNFAANQSKLPPEKWSHTVKGYSKNCIKGVSSTPLLKTQTLTRGSKCTKNYFLRFYYHLSHA